MADNLEDRYKALSKKREKVQMDKVKVEQELQTRKRALREVLENCKTAGFNPDTLEDDIKKASEVLSLKMDAFENDLVSAENVLNPMIQGME